MNHPAAKPKIIKQALKIAVLSVGLALVMVTPALAMIPTGPEGEMPEASGGMSIGGSSAIETISQTELKALEKAKAAINKGTSKKSWEQLKTWFREEAWIELKNSAAIAYKAALKNFLNNLAYDMATYLATGDKGQMPMFQTQGWGGYLQNAADNAAGTFIEALGKNMAYGKFNLCSPNLNVILKINLGLVRSVRPKKPACTFSQMTKNWEKALTDKDFLPKFQDMFNPWSNDLGIALTLQTGMTQNIERDLNAAILERTTNQGFKDKLDEISKYIKTPARTIINAADTTFNESSKNFFVYTGSIAADSIDVFINTLMGKLIEKWLRGGLVTKFPKLTNKLDDLNAQNPAEGAAGAKDRMKSIVEPNFKVRADYDILAELVTCPDPNKAGPTNCVIDEKFRQAIEKKLTVGQALEQGYLNGNGIFGFTSDGLEPKFNEGYPYRSMLILRKYRIIPAGWEAAGQKIKDLQGAGGVDGTKNLSDLVDCFDSGANWCRGLVDPDWVLKAPQNFCKKEGAGPEIISEQVTGEGADSSLAVLRNDAYCADEQSCIKEKTDGSCRAYGYCTAEKRKWDFNANGCLPLYNTCQTFSSTGSLQGGSSGGGTISYLENTLDFGVCNAGNAGCQAYCQDYNLGLDKFTCANTTGKKIHLNKQAESCDEGEEGCHGFIRTKAGLGANLLINADFELPLENGGWSNFGSPSATAYQGSQSLKMNGLRTRQIFVGPVDYSLASESYALSFYAKDCAATGNNFWLGVNTNSAILNPGADWIRYSLDYTYPAGVTSNQVTFTINSGSCLIDNIKLERGEQATNFSDYAAGPSLIYEKIRPPYLTAACGGANPPSACQNFARYCSADEAGCELYTSVTTETKIPAKVKREDYCPAVCVGYNTFVQSQTIFDNSRDAYFIPKTAKSCGAEAAGCDQFTNLDEVKKGGEGIEYYTSLRQCLKKTGNENSCGEFYSWEGSDESGYQLKVESLKKTGSGPDEAPDLTEPDGALCSEAIYNLPPSDPAYQADCRQFYNRAGGISYHLASRTIACSDDCHPYRRTALNVDDDITLAGSCTGVDKHWDAGSSQCVVCKSGGIWSADNNSCIYMAVPGQGASCAAAQNGCREYVGNTGNNVRDIFTDDFTGGAGGWQGINPTTVTASNVAINLGSDNRGHSLLITSPNPNLTALAKRQIGSSVSQGLDYVLNFVVKADAPAGLTFSLINANGQKADFKTVQLNGDWQILSTSLSGLDHEATSSEIMRATAVSASAGNNFYIDSITLTEITDRYYLIKNSWRTPDACDEDQDHRPWPGYMLGCDQYKDRADKTHNLKQFNRLCSEAAVGCELVIDTQNSSEPGASFYKDGQKTTTCSTGDCVQVPADDFTYAVYDQEKLCGADAKGCERLGRPYRYESAALYSDVYLKNNPDQYGTILCGANAVGCEAFAYDNGAGDNGETYFKDPGDQVCEYRQQKSGTGQSYGWYKKKVKRCGGNAGAVCLSNTDCSAPAICQLETDDKLCPTGHCADANKKVCSTDADCSPTIKCQEDLKTLGLGGAGGSVSQPAGNGWAGLCAAADSGCSEYLDPLSKFNTNLIFNGSFQILASLPTDGWASGASCPAGSFCQSVILEPNTVYRLAREAGAGELKISGCPANSLYKINDSNALMAATSITVVAPSPDRANSQIFYYQADAAGSCTIEADYNAASRTGAVELKKAVIDYQLAQNLDSRTCNGIVNTGQGCVLFNERKQAGANLAVLTWDADTTANGGSPARGHCSLTGTACSVDLDCTGAGNTCQDKDSNLILKVAPDRVCDRWLACKSYIKDAKGDNVCFDIGLCDAVDQNGNCQSFISSPKTNQAVGGNLTAESISNLSGYAKVGLLNSSLKTDYYPFGAMEQTGEVANFANGGFEYYGSNLYPVGWIWGGAAAAWNANIFSVINNPIAAQTEGIGYAREGASFLKLGSSYNAVSEQIDVIPNTDYIITAYLNTKNLKSGQAKIDILNSAGTATPIAGGVITQDLGNDWSFQMGRFTTGNTDSQIKIKLYSLGKVCGINSECSPGLCVNGYCSSSSEGNFYYDDIKIRPALESKCLEANGDCKTTPYNAWYTPQSCRLYPQSDSLACDYYEESGKRQKGWPGYCLEYDRRPGDPNVCLLWYPIDKVKGDGIEEGAGYADKVPAYYCLDRSAPLPLPPLSCGVDLPDKDFAPIKEGEYVDNIFSAVYLVQPGAKVTVDEGGGTKKSQYALALRDYNTKIWTDFVSTAAATENIWTLNVSFPRITKFDGLRLKCVNGDNGVECECKDYIWSGIGGGSFYCQTIAQVVTPTGQNKYWSGRVYQGSDYQSNCFDYLTGSAMNCNYNSDYLPFGSLVSPPPSSNPYEWDGKTSEIGNQPLFFEAPDTNLQAPYQARAGQLNNSNGAKRLFAQSYGAWQWTGTSTSGRYTTITPNPDWDPPHDICSGPSGARPVYDPADKTCSSKVCCNGGNCNTCPSSSCDYCAIPPKVENVKVNSEETRNVIINKNGFINLTFNTKADSQQLPLVMYGVDWGDGTNTMVTGVEMRDKSNPLQPESVYHLYSYWDLKAKKNSGGTAGANINCITVDEVGQCSIQPKIQIKDNWGWCSGGREINKCDNDYNWQPFVGMVIVKEK